MGGCTCKCGKFFHVRKEFADERKKHAILILTGSKRCDGSEAAFSGLRFARPDYFPLSGTLRCSSSTKFSRKITRPDSSCAGPPPWVKAAMRFPSGATSYCAPSDPLSANAILCPDHTLG